MDNKQVGFKMLKIGGHRVASSSLVGEDQMLILLNPKDYEKLLAHTEELVPSDSLKSLFKEGVNGLLKKNT